MRLATLTSKLTLLGAVALAASLVAVVAVYCFRAPGTDSYARPSAGAQTASPVLVPVSRDGLPPNRANEQDFRRTYDPALGYAPTEFLHEELKYLGALRKQRAAGAKSAGAAEAVVWEERGPDNIGGRTRALLWDPNDATGNKVWAGGVSGGLWYNNNITSSTSAWQRVDDLWPNLAVTAIAADPNNSQIMYVGTGEGFFTGAVRGAGIWKTTDGGATWAQISGTQTMYFVSDLVVRNEGGSSVLYVGVHMSPVGGNIFNTTYYAGLWRSTNGGTSFTQVLPTQYAVSDIEIGADNRLYVGTMRDYNADLGFPAITTDGAILFSDNGTTWTENTQYSAITSTTRIELACAPSDANTVYALVCHSSVIAAIGKSTNKGVSFTNQTEPADVDNGIPDTDFSRGQAWYDLIMAVNPSNADDVVVGGINLHRTTTGGASWSHLSKWSNNAAQNTLTVSFVHADQHAIAFHPTRANEVIFGTDGGVFWTNQYSTATLSAVIQSRNNNYNVTQFYAGAVSEDAVLNGGNSIEYYIAGAQDNGTQFMEGDGLQAGFDINGGDGAFCFIDPTSDRLIASYVYNNYSFFSYENGYRGDLVDENTGDFINPADVDWGANMLYSSEGLGTYRRTAIPAAGAIVPPNNTTEVVNMNATGGPGSVSAIRVSPATTASNSIIWVGTDNGRLYRITNANTALIQATDFTGPIFPSNRVISSISFGGTESHIVVTFSQYGVTSVFESRNGGTTWTTKEGNLPNIPIRWAEYNPLDPQLKQVFVATESGVYMTNDITAVSPVWTPLTNGHPNVRTDMLRIRKETNTLYSFTYGRGVFSAPLPTVTSNEGPNLAIEAVDVFPNPATTQARVRGTLKRPSAVSFQISDLSGRTRIQRSLGQVATFDETVILTSLSAGSYMLTVRAGEEVKTTRLVVR